MELDLEPEPFSVEPIFSYETGRSLGAAALLGGIILFVVIIVIMVFDNIRGPSSNLLKIVTVCAAALGVCGVGWYLSKRAREEQVGDLVGLFILVGPLSCLTALLIVLVGKKHYRIALALCGVVLSLLGYYFWAGLYMHDEHAQDIYREEADTLPSYDAVRRFGVAVLLILVEYGRFRSKIEAELESGSATFWKYTVKNLKIMVNVDLLTREELRTLFVAAMPTSTLYSTVDDPKTHIVAFLKYVKPLLDGDPTLMPDDVKPHTDRAWSAYEVAKRNFEPEHDGQLNATAENVQIKREYEMELKRIHQQFTVDHRARTPLPTSRRTAGTASTVR